MGQANGPDVDLVVRGTELYATYETPEGFPAIYDDALGLFCYARIVDGRFHNDRHSRDVAAADDVKRHATESDDVRMQKNPGAYAANGAAVACLAKGGVTNERDIR